MPLSGDDEVRAAQSARVTDADKGDAVVSIKSDPGVSEIGGDRHVGDAMEAIGAHIHLVAIALPEVVDIIVSAVGRKDEGVRTGYHRTGRGSGRSQNAIDE